MLANCAAEPCTGTGGRSLDSRGPHLEVVGELTLKVAASRGGRVLAGEVLEPDALRLVVAVTEYEVCGVDNYAYAVLVEQQEGLAVVGAEGDRQRRLVYSHLHG